MFNRKTATLKEAIELVKGNVLNFILINHLQNTEGDYDTCLEHTKKLLRSTIRIPFTQHQIMMQFVNPAWDFYLDNVYDGYVVG